MLPLLYTVILALGGALLVKVARVPGSFLMGSMLGTGIGAAMGVPLVPPHRGLTIAAQIVVGLLVGLAITPEFWGMLRRTGLLVVQTVAVLLLSALAAGYLLAHSGAGGLDLRTALVASAPGGVQEMVALATATTGQGAPVAAIHLLRSTIVLALYPWILKLARRRQGRAGAGETAVSAQAPAPAAPRDQQAAATGPGAQPWPSTLLAYGCGIGAGCGAYFTHIPAGTVLGALAGSAACKLAGLKVRRPPSQIRWITQLVLGAGLGTRFTAATWIQLQSLLLPGLLLVTAMVLVCLVLGWLICRRTGWELSVGLLSAAPAGLSEIVMSSNAADDQMLALVFFHTVRVVAIVTTLPLLLRLVAGL